MDRMAGGQLAGAGEDLGESAAAGADVKDGENRRRQVLRQLGHQLRERLDSPRGGADDDDIVIRGHEILQVEALLQGSCRQRGLILASSTSRTVRRNWLG